MSSAENPTPSPCCGCKGTPEKSSRRDFLLLVGVGLNVIAGALISLPIIGYALSSFVKKNKLEWVSLGLLTKFAENRTQLAVYKNPNTRPWDGDMGDLPCWVRRMDGEKFQIFAINCTHLGCPVRWFEESKLFMCPCHGGVFYQNGDHASGPPPRGLYTYEFKVENGELMILAGEIPSLSNQKP